jgi:hypothetical protein
MEDILSGIGIFVCVGAVILVILAVVGLRSVFAGRDRDNVRPIDQPRYDDSDAARPVERPRYDDREIETSGGFGGVPATGGARTYDPDRREDRDRDGVPDDLERRRRRADADDDDVRSSGGFGSS